jgi:hypothetical protein
VIGDFRRAGEFDEAELPVVRRAYDRYGRAASRPGGGRSFLDEMIEAHGGDPTARAEAALIRRSARAAGGGLYAQEGLRIRLARFKAELLGPDPTAIEGALVDSIGCAWLDVMESQERAARAAGDLALLAYLDRRLERATRRLHSGLRALDLVRRKAVPSTAIQVNLGLPGSPPAGSVASGAPAEPLEAAGTGSGDALVPARPGQLPSAGRRRRRPDRHGGDAD